MDSRIASTELKRVAAACVLYSWHGYAPLLRFLRYPLPAIPCCVLTHARKPYHRACLCLYSHCLARHLSHQVHETLDLSLIELGRIAAPLLALGS
jgi:hypothetical protein